VDRELQNQQTVMCEVKSDSGQAVEGRFGQSDTEQTDGNV
jgi:hypothetical protein